MEKILECNRFSAGIRTREKIETVEVVNLEARAVWGKLKPATRYTWYTEVENEIEKNPVWYLVLLSSVILVLVVMGAYIKQKSGKEDE